MNDSISALHSGEVRFSAFAVAPLHVLRAALSLADDLRGISFYNRMREFIYTINATIAKHPTENAIFFALSFLSYRFIALSSAVIFSRFIAFLPSRIY